MKQFEAKTLEEAYELASSDFSCSITSLNIEIIQQPSRGFLGFGKKNAIISASIKQKIFNQQDNSKYTKNKNFKKKIVIEDVATTIANVNTTEQTSKSTNTHNFDNDPRIDKKEKIFESFYNETTKKPIYENAIVKKDLEEVIEEIKEKVNELFSYSCYDIDQIEVRLYDEQTVFIGFTGTDSALLIGKEGYRYKALSYILFNWINTKYNLMLRLEVAQFLENQEIAINNYLEPVIEKIKETGSYKTKALDGILVHIALTKLRDEFPDKYVAVKTNIRGDKYILVNEYKKQ
jgi:spoIIIJ-associated protein